MNTTTEKQTEKKTDEELLAEVALSGKITSFDAADKAKDKQKFWEAYRRLNDESELCHFYYKGSNECTRMTNILQDAGVVGFSAIMDNQKRSCCGRTLGCYFIGKPLKEEVKEEAERYSGKKV